MNDKKSEDTFVKELEQKIAEIKHNDKRRHDYMIMTAFEADAKRMGRLEGRSEGIRQGFAEGEAKGFSDGSRQKAFETARVLKQLGDSVKKIMQVTGLSRKEVEALK